MSSSVDEAPRRAYPFAVRAIGIVDGRCCVVRANYDRLEVRDEGGALCFEHDAHASSHGLLRRMVIVDGHLACEIADVNDMPYGLRVWDLRTSELVIDVETASVDAPYLCFSPPGRTVLVSNDGGLALWDVVQRRRVRTWTVVHPLCASVDPSSGRLACGELRRVDVYDAESVRIASWSVEGEVEELAWCAGGRWLIGRAAHRSFRVWDGHDGSPIATLSVRGDLLAASASGRWIALTDGIVSLDDLSVRPITASAAVFDEAVNGFALVHGDEVWRAAC